MRTFSFIKYALACAAISGASWAQAAELKDMNISITPDPASIPETEVGNIQMTTTIDGEWANYIGYYSSEYFKATPMVVQDNLGLKYTDVYLQIQQDDNWNNYYLLHFDKALEQGSYTIIVPESYFQVSDWDTGDIKYENNATTISLTVGEGTILPPDTGFTYQSLEPRSGSTVDSSMTDWIIATFYEQAVTVNADVKPYLLYNDDTTIEADNIRSMADYGDSKQVNLYFDGMNNRPNGDYTLVVPAGFVSYADGQTNNAYTAKYSWAGGKNVNEDPTEVALVSATLGSYNLLEEGNVISNITPEGVYLTMQVQPESIEGIWYTLLDVTGLTPEQYSKAPAVFSNVAEASAEGVKTGDTFTKEIYSIEGYTLYNDKEYIMQFELCNTLYPVRDLAGTFYSKIFTGETESFKFSPVEIVSITPEPGSVFTTADEMVVTFTAPVTLKAGQGYSGFGHGNAGWSDFTNMKSNEDKTVWTIKFANSDINSAAGPGQIDPHIAGVDANGLVLRPTAYEVDEMDIMDALVYNGGVNETSYTVVRYDGYAKCPQIVVAEAAEPVEELTHLTFSTVGDKEINFSWMVAYPEIKNEEGETVATVLMEEFEATKTSGDESNLSNIELQVPLSEAITTPGKYTVDLPWNLFTVGRELSSYPSAPGTFTLNVETETGVAEINAEGTAEYYTLQGVKTTNPDKGIYIKVVNGKAIKVIR